MSAEPRRNLCVPLEVQVRLPDGAVLREWAVNLSAGGLCLHASAPLPSKEGLRLAFDLPPGGPGAGGHDEAGAPVRFEDVAAHVVWEGEGGGAARFHEIGLRFEELTRPQARTLAAWAAQPTDRRR